MRFIGDVHGDVLKYMSLTDGSTESVQVGDFGIGFGLDYDSIDRFHADGRHKFIRGNHDDPALCLKRPGFIKDGTCDAARKIMYVGGAWSIDWVRRVSYMDRGGPACWWKDEELSEEELGLIGTEYAKFRPKIMVTHDAPTSVANEFFIKPFHKKQFITRTAEALDKMFRAHQPDVWLFGHWHEDVDEVIHGTRFICLGINNYIDLEV